MSRGRRGEKTYTGPNGAATDVLRGKDKLRVHGRGVDSRVAPPSQEAMRAFIATQTCPWCAAGPFKMLATHTGRVHGVDAAELRTLAGLTRHAPLCDPEVSANHAARLAGQRLPDVAYERLKGRGRIYSDAGKESQRAKSALGTQTDRERAARIGGDKQLAENAAKHDEIIRRFRAGEPFGAIAHEVGVVPETVRRTLKRAGLYIDGRRLRWDR